MDALNAAYGDILEAELSSGSLNETYQIVIDAVRLIIFSFSIVFALVVVQMVCAKAFLAASRIKRAAVRELVTE